MAAPAFTLYHFDTCPYCLRVRRALDDLGIEVELKNVQTDPQAHATLVEATGRATVPVLYLHQEQTWMPESGDIVRFLYAQFGNGRKPPLSARINPQWLMIGLAVAVLAFLMLR